MFSFKVFLLFWVITVGGQTSRKGNDFSKKRQFLQLVLVFSQMRKFNNVKAAGSAVTAVLKKLSQLSKKLSQLSKKKTIAAIIRQLLLGAEVDEVIWMISSCWREYSAFISWVWLKIVRSLLRVSCYFGYSSWLLGFEH